MLSVKALCAHALGIVQSSPLIPRRLRVAILRLRGSTVGRSARIAAGSFFGPNLTIGDRCFINRECLIETSGHVTIGDDVHLAMRVLIATSGHHFGPELRRCGDRYSAPVSIGSGSWIGAGATVLPGVSIGHGAIIAAGSVVTADVEDNSLYAGVPASLKRRL